jgi:hypothetical protein
MGSRCIFSIKVLIEIINFWTLELVAKIVFYWDLQASKLTNYFFVKLIFLYNAQLNVSPILKFYQNDILWYSK